LNNLGQPNEKGFTVGDKHTTKIHESSRLLSRMHFGELSLSSVPLFFNISPVIEHREVQSMTRKSAYNNRYTVKQP